jgi:alpha-beta hydrolase superfamily lysophospholipase
VRICSAGDVFRSCSTSVGPSSPNLRQAFRGQQDAIRTGADILRLAAATQRSRPLHRRSDVRRRQPAHLLEIDGVDVDVAIYKDARHALLNETNQDQVTTDIIGWLLLHG